MHDRVDEDGKSPDDAAAQGSPWERERHARSWWVDADEREARDDAAEHRTQEARSREDLAYGRIREVTRRLNALDAGEAHQQVHLQQAAQAIQEVIDSGADEPLARLLREVLKLLDVQFADVIAAGVQRSGLRADLQHADQFLAGAADDRSAASVDRDAAAADRSAAARDRDSARTSRRSAADYRAADEPGPPVH